MAIKSILVYVDPNAENRLAVAFDLARRHDATLIGLAAGMWQPAVAAMAGAEMATISADLIEAARAQIENEFAQSAGIFETAAKNTAVRTVWRAERTFPFTAMCDAAAAADLVIVGSAGSGVSLFESQKLNPGDIVIGAGRPVLVVPETLTKIDARNIVFAWKNTREARRAMADGLPFMKSAGTVTVLQVRESDTDADSTANVEAFLDRHGIVVRLRIIEQKNETVEEELIKVAADTAADLIIAGGFGTNRFREWVFGGVTRGLLKQNAIACQLSH